MTVPYIRLLAASVAALTNTVMPNSLASAAADMGDSRDAMTRVDTASRGWSAKIISGMRGENRTLTVSGEVEVGSPGQVPTLHEAKSPDSIRNPDP